MMWKAITIAVLATLARPSTSDAEPLRSGERERVETATRTELASGSTRFAVPTTTELPTLKASF